MDLLPRSHREFTSPEYWNSFFKKQGHKAFEWYGEFAHLCGIVHKYIKPTDKVLMVGCGNSRLSEDMYDVGYHNITNIDISDTVIRQMNEKNNKTRGELTYEKMDATQMTYEDGTFSVAVDKGTLDALAVDQEEKTLATVNAMFEEVSRVLRLGGRYVIVSLLQDQVLQVLTKHFAEVAWPIRVHRIQTTKEDDKEKEFSLPVFAVVITKFKKMPNMKQIVEVCAGEDSVQRLESLHELVTTVKEMQYYGIVRQKLGKRQVTSEQLQISLYSSLASTARYTLWVVDSENRCNNKFAIFIVPQGRETEWMFATDAGRKALSARAGFERLVVVALSREHEYESLEAIKAELSSKVMELVPPSHRKGVQVPFLSIGSDIGKRTIRHRGESALSGSYVVEDAEGEGGCTFRRLIFLSSQNVVQSEARLTSCSATDKKKKKGSKKKVENLQIDKSYLACGHHHAMVAGLAFLAQEVPTPRVLLIGLGGGPLAAFINQHFPQVCLEAVEIDPEMAQIACDWFGFKHDENVSIHIADGLNYIRQLADTGEKRDVILFDVDSKDSSVGLSCPPAAFVDETFLKLTAGILVDGGVFVLNFVCRDETLQKTIVSCLGDIFPTVSCIDIPEEVNRVIFASTVTSEKEGEAGSSSFVGKVKESAKRLDREIKKVSRTCEVDVSDCIKDLQVLCIK